MDFQLVMDHGHHNRGDHDHGSGNHLYVKHNTTIPFEISFRRIQPIYFKHPVI